MSVNFENTIAKKMKTIKIHDFLISTSKKHPRLISAKMQSFLGMSALSFKKWKVTPVAKEWTYAVFMTLFSNTH